MRWFHIAAMLVGIATAAEARITQIRVETVEPFAGGASFGDTGAYEKVSGVVAGEIDPSDPRNKPIAGLDRAPRNASGQVEYDTDFVVLRPADPARGNHHLLFDVTNRGNKLGMTLLNQVVTPANAIPVNDPSTTADAGDGLLLRLGYTIAWTGWDPAASSANHGMSIRLPVLLGVTQEIRDEFVSGTREPPIDRFRLSYRVAQPEQGTLTMRRRAADAPEAIQPDHWRFSGPREAELLPPGTKPEPGTIYSITYVASDPWVSGIAYAATRDTVSFLRANQAMDPARGITGAIGFGISLSARFLRGFIAEGFNQDDRGARVFDGVLTHAGGAGKAFINALFAQPERTRTQHEDADMPEEWFPFSAAVTRDPATGSTGAILRGDGFDPKLIEVNTSSEYWQKGASLLTTEPTGAQDVALPPTARAFLVAGTQHTGKAGSTDAHGPCINRRNPHNPAPALRALLADLDVWISGGPPAPASRVPTRGNRTLVAAEALDLPQTTDLVRPLSNNPVVARNDPASLTWVHPVATDSTPYRALVPAVDADGNERAGIVLPDLAAPFATYTGWNLYAAPFPSGELCDRDGSLSPFSRTADARLVNADPRPSLAERYPNRQAVVTLVQQAVAELITSRLLLSEDGAQYLRWAQEVPITQ